MPSVFDCSLTHDPTTLLGLKNTPSFLKSDPSCTQAQQCMGGPNLCIFGAYHRTSLSLICTPSFLKFNPTSTSISVYVGTRTHMPIHSIAR